MLADNSGAPCSLEFLFIPLASEKYSAYPRWDPDVETMPFTVAMGVSIGLPVPTAGEEEADDALGSPPPVCRDAALGRDSGPIC